MNDPTISINDVGPITEFSYTPADFGLHILRGAQGAGKTTILRTMRKGSTMGSSSYASR